MNNNDQLQVKTLKQIQAWLDKNHGRSESVWLVYPKPTSGIGDITMTELIDVLLCYGWIDSLPRKVDDTWTSIRISPRNQKSNWSRVNKDKIKRLEKAGRMKTPGKEMVQLAKQTGTWYALNDVENLVLPPDLKKALQKKRLKKVWDDKSRRFKRGLLEQLFNSKKQETRDKKIAQILSML